MNEIEFERIARHAAANLRDEAERISDGQGSLALLLASESPVHTEPSPEVVSFADIRPRRRSPWMPILVAASTIAVFTGAVLFANRGGDESIIVTTEPTQPQQPHDTIAGDIESTVPDTDESGTNPDTAAPPVPTTLPEVLDQGPVSPFVFQVPDESGQALARSELLTADIGSGEFELGWDDCQECEQLRPWAPVVDAEGTIYIADVVNERWRVVRQGVSTNIPFTDGEVVAGSPVIGPDGYLYAALADELAQTAPRRVVAYDPVTLEERASYPVGRTISDRLQIVNGQLELGTAVIRTFDMQLGTPTVDIDHGTAVVTVSLSGTQREFQFPEGWLINGRDAIPIDNGSVVVRALAPLPADEARFEVVLVRLWLDGTTAVGVVGNDSSTNSAIQITSAGLVQMEGTTVVRYELPEFAGGDPLAGWVVPGFEPPAVAQVPRLLPQISIADGVTSIRTEGDDAAVERPSYSQTWVRADGDGAVDAIVQIDTRFEPRLIGNPTVDAQVPRWPKAYFSETIPPVEVLSLHSATRSMTVWTTGLGQGDVVEATTSLRVDSDAVGWAIPRLPEPDRWTPVHEGWYTGAASRNLQQQPPDSSTYLEMWTVTGVPDAIGTPGLLVDTITLGSIGDRPALLFDGDGDRSAVTWSPSEGVVVVLGSFGPLDQLFEIATSVVEVDQATWEAASTLDTSDGDGCNSMFC